MLEWGDIPSHLETLTSENENENGMERTTVTVLPEVGCGIDNLETTKKVQVYAVDNTRWHTNGLKEGENQVVTIDRSKNMQSLDLETIFQTADERVTDNRENKMYQRRIRVSFSLDFSTTSVLSTDISMQVERQWSQKSTRGTAWTGEASNSGGLDARTVMSYIGKDIVYGDVFSVKREKQNVDRWDILGDNSVDVLSGEWIQSMVLPGSGSTQQCQRHRSEGDFGLASITENSGITTMRLPQNILVRFGCGLDIPGSSTLKEWAIEVSHFDSANVVNEIDESMHKKHRRRVVLRVFGELEGNGNKEQSTYYYWTEVKR
eukprot:CCRYP_017231-RA/>CCRYP_017231-RA protein AED:0.04 eAED:0.04 QI:257/1/1/1/0/0/2/73/318